MCWLLYILLCCIMACRYIIPCAFCSPTAVLIGVLMVKIVCRAISPTQAGRRKIGSAAFSLQKWKSYESFLSLRKICNGKYKGLSVTSSKSITVIENEDVLAFIYTFMLHYGLSLYNPMCFLFPNSCADRGSHGQNSM